MSLLQYPWSMEAQHLSTCIETKELFPFVMAAAVQGHVHVWCNSRIKSYFDNLVVVAGLNARSSWDKYLMHVLR